MKVKIQEESIIFDEFFKVKKGTLTHELYNGDMSKRVVRYSVAKKDGVGALLVDRKNEEVILVEQYRYPMSDWLIEVVAGGVEVDESKDQAVRREILEETGYHVEKLELIQEFYVSPGLISEKVYLYMATINESREQIDYTTIMDEGEDIKLVRIPFVEIKNWINSKKIADAKTLIALYYFMLNRQ